MFEDFLIPIDDIICKRGPSKTIWWNVNGQFGMTKYEEGWHLILLENIMSPSASNVAFNKWFKTRNQALAYVKKHQLCPVNFQLELGQENNRYPVLSPKFYPNYTSPSVVLRKKEDVWKLSANHLKHTKLVDMSLYQPFKTRHQFLLHYHTSLTKNLYDYYQTLGKKRYLESKQKIYNNKALNVDEHWLLFVYPNIKLEEIW